MPDYRIDIDGRLRTVEDVPEWLPLLWVLRDKLGITGPKYGCGIGACRACTCHVTDGQGGFVEFQPCVTPVKDVGKLVGEQGGRPMPSVRTIEGMASEDGTLHPVQEAWVELDVPQCGFCQPGQIMTATALLWQKRRGNQQVTDEDIDGIENVCRCGTYGRIREAIKVAAAKLDRAPDADAEFASTNPASDAEPLPKDAENQSGDPVSETVTGLPGASTPSTPGNSRLRSDDGPSGGSDDGGSSDGGLLGGLLGRR